MHEVADAAFHVARDPDGSAFVWRSAGDRYAWWAARAPASDGDIRQIEEIAIEELRAADRSLDAAGVARFFAIRRMTTAAKARIERARADGDI